MLEGIGIVIDLALFIPMTWFAVWYQIRRKSASQTQRNHVRYPAKWAKHYGSHFSARAVLFTVIAAASGRRRCATRR